VEILIVQAVKGLFQFVDHGAQIGAQATNDPYHKLCVNDFVHSLTSCDQRSGYHDCSDVLRFSCSRRAIMDRRNHSEPFNFSSSFEQTLKEFNDVPEASQVDFQRIEEWRDEQVEMSVSDRKDVESTQ